MIYLKNNRKKTLLLLGFIFVLFFKLNAMDFKFNDNWGKPGYTLKKINAKRLEINFSIHNFSLNNIIVKDKIMQKISLQGYFLPNDEGCPDLPGGGRYIAIPQGAVVSFQIISSRTEILTNIDLSPAPRIPLVSEESLPEYNKNEQVIILQITLSIKVNLWVTNMNF